ncbi:MAG: GTPase [Cyanobacteria bacterium P01_D01_bin.56]
MEIMRLMVTGPHGAGKSTFIRSVGQIAKAHSTPPNSQENPFTPTAITPNFGQFQIGPNQLLHLYKTPVEAGPPTFNFMWDVLLQKVHAYILLVPANKPQEFRHARLIHRFIQQRISLPMIVGLTHTDLGESWDMNTAAIAIGFTDVATRPPIVSINATSHTSVVKAMMLLVNQCIGPSQHNSV